MKLLFFSPHAAIWPHALPEARVLAGLQRRGHEAIQVACGGVFSDHCTCMSAARLDFTATDGARRKICAKCDVNRALISGSNRLDAITLSDVLGPEDHARAGELVSTADRHRRLSLVVDGVDVGRLAAYEVVLAYKKMSEVLNEQEWSAYRVGLKNCILSLIGFGRIFEQARPDAVLIYSPQYGVNNVAAAYAQAHGRKVYFLEAGTNLAERLETLRVWDWTTHHLVNPVLQHWQRFSKIYFGSHDLSAVTAHYTELISGDHFNVYSSPYTGAAPIRQLYSVRDDQRILLATLSSHDEAYAAWLIGAFPEDKVFSSVFRTQLGWLRATIGYMRRRADLFLVIRVHPRDFPNKRDPVRSEQSHLLARVLVDLPDNVAVNWPADRISLYGLFDEVSAVLTGWSATAIEALALGLPVVTYDERLASYPGEITYTGTRASTYFANIDRALEDGWSFDHVINAFRWWVVNFRYNTIRVSDAPRTKPGRGQIRRAARKAVRAIDPGFYKRRDLGAAPSDSDWIAGVDEMITRSLSSLMEAAPSRAVVSLPADQGRRAVRDQLAALCAMLYPSSGGPARAGTLQHRIRTFLESPS